MKKISIFLLTISVIIATSCDNKFEELNVDPNRATEVPAHLLLGNVIRNTQNTVYSTFNGGDMGLCWAQQWSKVEYNDEERYAPRQVSMDNIWNVLYINVLKEAQVMEMQAKADKNSNLQAVSIILTVNAFQILTDMYGPIPYKEALDEAKIKPKYDTEKDIYAGLITRLEEADALFAAGQGSVPVTSDIVFKGDFSKWRKLGNALKLKVLMRISKVGGVQNPAKIQALVSSGGLMTSNADTAAIGYLAAQPDANPIYETIVFGNRGEYKMSKVLVDKLIELDDPRLPVYAQPIGNGSYVGNIPGTRPASAAAFSSIGTFILSPTFPGVIMSYAQQQLLLAEAANEDYITGGTDVAKVYYNEGIAASAIQFGTAMPTSYFTQGTVDFLTQTEARQKIAEQEWIALYGQGLEAWTEWRRNKFPVLTPVVEAVVPYIPSRLLYNSLEATLNKVNFNAASALLNNGNKLNSKLVWVK
jgi:hypothetical protein